MKAPGFPLMKRSQIAAFFHLQMPQWLFKEPKYSGLSLYAKVAYTFLLNRCQLSRRNGWVSERDEVYIIFTREELAAEMQISYKRAIASFRELQDANLIWEQRRGRGLPNHIYLADAEHEIPQSYRPAAFSDSSASPAEAPVQTVPAEAPIQTVPAEAAKKDFPNGATPEPSVMTAAHTSAPCRELPEADILTCRVGTSKPVKAASQDLPEPHPSNIYKKEIDSRDTEDRSVCLADREALKLVCDGCELDAFPQEERQLICSCISWLYYADEVRIGKCCYPRDYVRSRLYGLDEGIVQETFDRIHQNQKEIRRNTLAYVAKVLFSCLMEHQSWMALDPYLNRMRGGA